MRCSAFELANQRGDPLRGDLRWVEAPRPAPVVVVCHGFKGFKNWGFFPYTGERLAQAGFVSVCFNFSGSGIGPDLETFTDLERFARDTISQQIEDLGCVLDAIESGEIAGGAADARRIGVLGHSRGGGTAILRAREDARLLLVATWAGVSTLMRYSERELEEWRRRGFMEFLNTRTRQKMRLDWVAVQDWYDNAARFDLERAAAELRVPLLLLHGEEDLSVRVEEARALHAAAGPRAELMIVPRAGHTFGVEHPWKGTTPALERVLSHTIAWLQAQLETEPQGAAHDSRA